MQISRTFLKKKNRSTAPSRRRNVSELPCRNCWPRQRVRARGKKKKNGAKEPYFYRVLSGKKRDSGSRVRE